MAVIEDRDLGWKRIKRQMKMLDKSHTKVGLPKKAKPKSGHASDMSELVIVGAVHEFGAPKVHVPKRSWLRTGSDEAIPTLNRLIQKEYAEVLAGRSTVRRSLDVLGVFMVGRIKRKIRAIKFPPLRPSTLRKKTKGGKVGNNPLIDTGQFIQSIAHQKVIKKK